MNEESFVNHQISQDCPSFDWKSQEREEPLIHHFTHTPASLPYCPPSQNYTAGQFPNDFYVSGDALDAGYWMLYFKFCQLM